MPRCVLRPSVVGSKSLYLAVVDSRAGAIILGMIATLPTLMGSYHRPPRALIAIAVATCLVAGACVGANGEETVVASEPMSTTEAEGAPPTDSKESIARPSMCINLPSSARADDLLANNYQFSPHQMVLLSDDPDWSENPLDDNNWMFQYHTLRWSRSLLVKWQETGDEAYLDRFRFLLSDWYRDNPATDPPSSFSWNDHSTAWRATVFACGSEFIDEPWIEDALNLHGETLADPDFYVNRGNHAFNQAIGLLAVGCRLGNEEWTELASQRIGELVSRSIDQQGVTNEQAVEYQLYNRSLYVNAAGWFDACDLKAPSSLGRVDEMYDLLVHATMPNGEYVMIGDTGRRSAEAYSSSEAEFTASGGESGTQPESTSAVFDAGYFFTRTGWGEDRAFSDEIYMSARFGPGRAFHGHQDGGSVTLYGYGTPLLIDPGKFTYNAGPLRDFFVGPTAHNIVIVEGTPYLEREPTLLQQVHRTTSYDFLTLERSIADGADWTREILFSRDGYVVVIDRVDQAEDRVVQQLWHLVEGSTPVIVDGSVVTERDRGNISITPLAPVDGVSLVEGSENPVQGWVSYDFGVREAAPAGVFESTGTQVVFVTLLAPSPAGETPEILSFELNDDGINLELVYLGQGNRVTIDGGAVNIQVIP